MNELPIDGRWPEDTPITGSRAPNAISVAIADGINLRVWHWPSSSDMTCVFIHGVGEGAFVWDEFCIKINHYISVYTLDLRGHGFSDHDEGRDYTVQSNVDDL